MAAFSVAKRTRSALAFATVCTALLADCRTPVSENATLKESGADAYNGFVSLFTQVIGRKPIGGADSDPGDFALFDNDPDKMVDNLLGSTQFQQDGFFNVHRDRLVLPIYQQSPQWVAGQHPNFCALRKEMQEVAQEDKSGANGYWQILKYQDRWVPLPPTVTGCFTGTTIGELQKAFQPPGTGTGGGAGGANLDDAAPASPVTPAPPAMPTGAPAVAAACAANAFYLGSYQNDYTTAIKAFGADVANKAPIDTPQGVQMLAAFITSQVKPSGTAAADVAVSLSTGSDGRPVMTEEYNTAPESSACSFRDMPADTSTWQQTPTSTVMVRAKISPKVAGLMANPFWLARHPTNTKNRGLHRARVVMFSYFCKEVSPAAAELAGGAAQVVPELAPYFPPGDIHQTASQACYNCHSTLMPLANFFTAMDKNDDPPPFGGDDGNNNFGPPPFNGLRYFQMNGALELPGGYWTFTNPGQGAFYGTNGTQYNVKGLGGLAALFSDKNFTAPAQCVVNSAWSSMFGSEHKMPDTFKAQALQAFQTGNSSGAPSYTEALRFILKSNYGKTYFSPTAGRPAFEALLTSGSALACDDTKSTAGFTIGQSKCYSCHNTVHKNGGIAFFTSGTKAALPITEANRHAAYCAVSSDDMPQDGPLGLDDKQNVLCWLHPTTEATPNCGGTAPPPGPDSPMHTLPAGM